MNHSKCFDYRHPFHCFNRSPSVTVKIFIEKPLGIAHKQRFGKMSTQPYLALCIQFLDRKNNDKNNTLPLGKQICFTKVWGCAEILPKVLMDLVWFLPICCIKSLSLEDVYHSVEHCCYNIQLTMSSKQSLVLLFQKYQFIDSLSWSLLNFSLTNNNSRAMV